jgi:hypothetical protein
VKSSLGKGLIGVGLALLAGFLLLRLVPPGPHDRFWQLAKGMTRAEVIAILGPPGDYRSQTDSTQLALLIDDLDNVEVWRFDEGHAEIAFDEHGRMMVRYWCETGQSTWFHELLNWLRW